MESDLGLYDQAILSLSTAIQKNPKNSHAYFERAIVYFEMGEFDQAIDDFLKSDQKYPLSDQFDFSHGLTIGLSKGFLDTMTHFVPSMLTSLQGLKPWTMGHSLRTHSCI